MKKLLRNLFINSINIFDSKLNLIISNAISKKTTKLNIYSLHSTRPRDFDYYKKILKYIDKKSKFINPDDIEFIANNNLKNKNYSILTLDDGFTDNYEFALKVLKELNIKGIFFIIQKFITKEKTFSKKYLRKLYPKNKYEINKEIKDIFQHMTKAQIKDLSQQGHKIGLHGLEHEDYGEITLCQIEENIKKSFRILKKLDIKPIHFAYPFGSKKNFTNASNQCIKKYFKYIYTGVRGINLINRFNQEKNLSIFRRNTLSTHNEDLVYYPIKRKEIYFFSFNKIVEYFYIFCQGLRKQEK